VPLLDLLCVLRLSVVKIDGALSQSLVALGPGDD